MAAVSQRRFGPQRGEVPIVVQLGAACAPLARAAQVDVFRERLAGEVDDILARLGLAGGAEVTVVESDSHRAVRIRVRGALQPYPADLPLRLWRVIAPATLLAEARERSPADVWFSEYVTNLGESCSRPDWTLAFELVQRLVREALWERAGCLVGSDQADALLDGATAGGDPPIDRHITLTVLRGLIDLAVPVVERDRLQRALERTARQGLSPDDTFEEALVAMRPRRIEILAHADTLRALAGGETLESAFLALQEELLVGRGVRLPTLELVPTPKLRPGMAAVRINGRSTRLDLGTGPLTLDALVSTLARELGRRAHLLVDVQEVECRIGQLQEMFPALVEALIGRLGLGDLTRILRELLREGVSIHDLKSICELLLEFDTVPADPRRYLVLDERLPLAEPDPGEDEKWRAQLEYVRRGLAYQLSAAHSHGGRLEAIVVDPALTGDAAAGFTNGGDRLDEADQEALRDALWAELARLRSAGSDPVVYTTAGGRAAIRALIAPEFPALPVLDSAEVRRGTDVTELATIRLPPHAA